MNTIRFTSKEAFSEALEERRPFWRSYDQRQAKQHKAAEQAWLVDVRKRLREALKFDYATMKEAVAWKGRLYGLDSAPSCPRLMEPKIDRVLSALNYTQGKSFIVDTNGAWSDAHDLLTADPDAPTSVC